MLLVNDDFEVTENKYACLTKSSNILLYNCLSNRLSVGNIN